MAFGGDGDFEATVHRAFVRLTSEDLPRAAAERVLRFHAGVVNAVALLADGRVATAGQDQRIALWRVEADKPDAVLEGHDAPVVALAPSDADPTPKPVWLKRPATSTPQSGATSTACAMSVAPSPR